LNGIASAINADSAAPISATVVNNSYGYQLQITDKTTGVGNNFQLSSAGGGGPLDPFQQTLNSLSLSQTQAAQNASYTVNGGASQSSTSNTVTLDTGITATLLTSGTTSIASGNATNVAQNAIGSYNALQGDIAALTSASGALNGNTSTATQLSSSLQSTITTTYTNPGSTLTTLAQIGITPQTPASSTSALAFNSTTFQSAYNTDPTGTLSLLSQAITQLGSVANGYTSSSNSNASTGILAQQQAIENAYSSSLQSANPAFAQLTPSLLNSFIQNELAQGSSSLGLTGFSAYG
jgi:flagellar hook-associated protein 2